MTESMAHDPPSPATVMIPLTPVQQAMREVCERFGITKAQLLGRCTQKNLVDARESIVVRLTNEFGMSRSAIGRIIKRDHTSVLYLLSRAKNGGGRAWRIKHRMALDG